MTHHTLFPVFQWKKRSISVHFTRLWHISILLFYLVSLVGAPTAMVQAAPAGTALQFDGTNDYVTFGPNLNASSFTLEAWVNRASGGATMTTGTNGLDGSSGRPRAYPVLTKGMGEGETPANINMNWFLGITSTGMVGADFEDNAGGVNHPAWGTTTVPVGEWHHIAAVYDGNCWALYLDGNLETLNAAVTACPNAAPESTSIQHAGLAAGIGSTGQLSTGFFAGTIDEARVWNVARTQTEIQSTLDVEITSGTGLIGRWGMNEGTGTIINSSVGTIPGTLTNGPTWTSGFPIPDADPPAAPTGLTATPGADSASLSWTANSESDLAGYNIYRSTASPVVKTTPINVSLVTSATYFDATATHGQTYYYAITAVDTSTNESGLSNEAEATPTAPSGDAYALQLDGTNDYVTFGPAPGLGVEDFTLEAWFYWTGGGATANTGSGGITAYPLITKGLHESDGSNVDANYFLGITTAGRLAADFEEYGGGQNYPVTGNAVVTTNAWHHAAVTYDGQTWKLYLDGGLDTSLTLAAPHTPRYDSIQHAGLGTAMNSTGVTEGYFAGMIDEVRIWNVARTQEEIRAEINNEVTSGTGLVARWGLNEGTGTTASSSVGTFIGTLTNGPVWVTPGAPFNIVFDTTPPNPPTGLTAIGANSSVTLDWDDNSEPDLAGYNVYRATTPGDYAQVNTSLVTTSDYDDTGLTNGIEYYYAVRAVDTSSNESDNSNETYAIPMADLGSGLEFTTASGTYVTFGDPAKLDLSTFTIETWFKRTGAGTPNTTGTNGIPNAIPLVTHGAPQAEGSNVDANWVLAIDDATDVIAADFEDMATGLNHPVYGVTLITNDTWHHAAATWDGTNWRLYLDGKLEITQSEAGFVPRSDTTQLAALGTMLTTTGGTNGFFQGVLDEARVWNRALTQSEIMANINQQLTSGTGLVARWGLNEGSGTVVGDSIAAAADGTITGANFAWVPGAPFDLNLTPDIPTLVAPADGATGVPVPATLSVHVDDARGSNLNVSFYGRLKNGPAGEDFTLIAIPDPQYYASTYPSIYNAQMNWVVGDKTTRNIQYVMSLGDNVNTSSSTTEWTNATTAWDILTAGGVPYGMVPGNHDGAPSNTGNFNTYFGSRIASQLTYGGRYGTSDYDNTYATFSAGGMDFIVLFIEYDTAMTSTSNPVLVWADGILQANPTRRTIVVTHDLLSGNNFTSQGSAIYNALKANSNLFLMLGGHLDTTGQRSDVYNGHTVYSLRSDYQFVDDQQSGYLRIMRFSPADNAIYVTTYSPTQDASLIDTANQFDLAYNMGGAAEFQLIGTVNDVPANSNVDMLWTGLAASDDYEWYAVASNDADAAVSPTWSLTTGVVVNEPPVITESDPQAVTMSEDGSPTPFGLTLNATDADLTDTLTWSISSPASNGTATASGTGNTVVVGYTPNADYTGSDSFEVQVSDGKGGTDTLTVNVTIEPINDAPLITGQKTFAVLPNTDVLITLTDLLVTDPDNVFPDDFTLTVLPGENYTLVGSTITPATDFVGELTVPVTVNDGLLDSNTYNLTISLVQTNNVYFVDNTNPACVDGDLGTLATPLCTISRGEFLAVPGDTVYVLNGTYAETVFVEHSGTDGSPITYHAVPSVMVTGDSAGFGSAFAIGDQSYIVIDGFNIYHTKYKGIYVDSSNNITISNNHVTYAGAETSPDTHQQGIFVRNTTNSLITGNTTDHNSCIGIRLINNSDYNVVSNNISFANASYIAYPVVAVSDAAGIEMTGSSYNTVINNITYGNEDSGINLYVNSSGVGSSYNLVVGNLSYGNGDHGIDNNDSPYNTIVGNTVHGNGTTGINFEGDTGSHDATVANNISAANGLTPPTGSFGGNLRVDAQSISGTTLDYNLFNPRGSAPVQIIWNDTSYNSLAEFKAAVTAQEVHGLEGDPLFMAPVASVLRSDVVQFNGSEVSGDYHLNAGSPAIDSANSDAPSQPLTDLDGNPRMDDLETPDTGAGTRTYDDRGAYEFQVSCFALTLSRTGEGNDLAASPLKSESCSANGQYEAGVFITLSGAAPTAGWQISGWTGTDNDTSTADTNTFTMPASAHTASVNYTQIEYTLTVNSDHGAVTKTPDQTTYHLNDVVSLNAVPEAGWRFVNWTGSVSSTDNPVDVTINENKVVTANYERITGCVDINVVTGWNMVSVPVIANDMTLGTLFPDIFQSAYAYTGSYQAVGTNENLSIGVGYWMYFNDPHTYQICGPVVANRQINVITGWNMIGPFEDAVAVSSISSTPDGILAPMVYGYNNGYAAVTTLQPGSGYWAFVSESGSLDLGASHTSSPAVQTQASKCTLNWQASIQVSDSNKNSDLLWIGQGPSASDSLNDGCGEVRMPPKPPAGAFDARLVLPGGLDASHQDYRSSLSGQIEWRLEFQTNKQGDPFTFTWDPAALPEGTWRLQDSFGGVLIDLDMTVQAEYKLDGLKLDNLLIRYEPVKTGFQLYLPLIKP